MKTNKILITGTGRSGTTIIVKLLSLLGLDTGYQHLTDPQIETQINQSSRGGLEHYLTDNRATPLIVKAPQFYNRIHELAKKYSVIKVYVPIRHLETSAKSRGKHGHNPGGLWGADDVNGQIIHNAKVVYEIAHSCSNNNIQVEFINFEKFTTDDVYAYMMYVKFAIDANVNHLTHERFTEVYNSVMDPSKITTK